MMGGGDTGGGGDGRAAGADEGEGERGCAEAAAERVRNRLDGLNGSNGLEIIETNKKS